MIFWHTIIAFIGIKLIPLIQGNEIRYVPQNRLTVRGASQNNLEGFIFAIWNESKITQYFYNPSSLSYVPFNLLSGDMELSSNILNVIKLNNWNADQRGWSPLDKSANIGYFLLSSEIARQRIFFAHANSLGNAIQVYIISFILFLCFVCLGWAILVSLVYLFCYKRRCSLMEFTQSFPRAAQETFEISVQNRSKLSLLFTISLYGMGILILGAALFKLFQVIELMAQDKSIRNITDSFHKGYSYCIQDGDISLWEMRRSLTNYGVLTIKPALEECFASSLDDDNIITLFSESMLWDVDWSLPDKLIYGIDPQIYLSHHISFANGDKLVDRFENYLLSIRANGYWNQINSRYFHTNPSFGEILRSTPPSYLTEYAVWIYLAITMIGLAACFFATSKIVKECNGGYRAIDPLTEMTPSGPCQSPDVEMALIPKNDKVSTNKAEYLPAKPESQKEQEPPGTQTKTDGQNQNQTLSLDSFTLPPNQHEGRPDKTWLQIENKSSNISGSLKYDGTLDFEQRISAIEAPATKEPMDQLDLPIEIMADLEKNEMQKKEDEMMKS